MDENTVLDETPAEEIPQTEKKGRKGIHSKPQKNKKKGGGKKGLVIALCVILALLVLAALFVFVVYGGRHMYLKTELGGGVPDASAFMKNGAEASYVGDVNVSDTKEGTYILKVKSGGKVRPELLIVRDTKAPTTDTTEISITIDDKALDAKEALGDVKDASEFAATWVNEPQQPHGQAHRQGARTCRRSGARGRSAQAAAQGLHGRRARRRKACHRSRRDNVG